MKQSVAWVLGCFVATAPMVVLPTAASADFYAGKTINMIVGRSAGSAADSTARAFARAWQKYIPGNPTIVIRNMGGTASWNYMAQVAEPDGLTVSMTPYDPTSQVMQDPAFQADYTEMEFVAAFYNPPLVLARTELVPDAHALDDVPRTLIYGGNNPAVRFDVFGRMTLDMLETDYRYTTGFGDSGSVVDALLRNEIDIATIGLNMYRMRAEELLVDTGNAVPLFYFPWPGHSDLAQEMFGDIPSFDDYFEAMRSEAPSGEFFDKFEWMSTTLNAMAYAAFLPPGTDPELRDILRAAADEAVNDPEFRAEIEAMFGFFLPYIDATLADEIIGAMGQTTDELRQFVADFVAAGTP